VKTSPFVPPDDVEADAGKAPPAAVETSAWSPTLESVCPSDISPAPHSSAAHSTEITAATLPALEGDLRHQQCPYPLVPGFARTYSQRWLKLELLPKDDVQCAVDPAATCLPATTPPERDSTPSETGAIHGQGD
jgi:hypothetical protein